MNGPGMSRARAVHARPSLPSRLTRAFLLWLYRRKGWRLAGGPPPGLHKCVIIGAPHTSNWDFIFFLGATAAYGIRPRFMGKASLFAWPLRRFMLEMGGVPVNRSASGAYVDSMVAAFAASDDMMLVIAPEGTRSAVRGWKSGFYHIALGAGVPIVCGWVDHARMTGGLGAAIMPTGDYTADMARIAAFYDSVMPDHPKLAVIPGREVS